MCFGVEQAEVPLTAGCCEKSSRAPQVQAKRQNLLVRSGKPRWALVAGVAGLAARAGVEHFTNRLGNNALPSRLRTRSDHAVVSVVAH